MLIQPLLATTCTSKATSLPVNFQSSDCVGFVIPSSAHPNNDVYTLSPISTLMKGGDSISIVDPITGNRIFVPPFTTTNENTFRLPFARTPEAAQPIVSLPSLSSLSPKQMPDVCTTDKLLSSPQVSNGKMEGIEKKIDQYGRISTTFDVIPD